MSSWKESMINRLSNLINRNRSAAKISQVLCSSDYTALSKDRLQNHKNVKHQNIKLSCDQCNFGATRSDKLNDHKQSYHEGIRFGCNLCDYKAKRKYDLKKHKQSKHF